MNKQTNYKMRALGTWNLLQVLVCIILIGLCVTSALWYIFSEGKGSVFQVLPILFIWPIGRLLYFNLDRYILLDGDRLVFHLEQQNTSIMSLPKFYSEEITLKELSFYGVFTDLYIKGLKKANRKKGEREAYDILTVKEGEIEIPVGLLKIGRPLAFVTKSKDSYVYDDAIFTDDQMSYLFHCIAQSSGKEPSGYIEAKESNHTSSKSGISYLLIGVLCVGLIAVSLWLPAIQTLWDKTVVFEFMQYSQLEVAYLIFISCGHLTLGVNLYSKYGLAKNNLEKANIISYISMITLGVFYSIACVLFAISLL